MSAARALCMMYSEVSRECSVMGAEQYQEYLEKNYYEIERKIYKLVRRIHYIDIERKNKTEQNSDTDDSPETSELVGGGFCMRLICGVTKMRQILEKKLHIANERRKDLHTKLSLLRRLRGEETR